MKMVTCILLLAVIDAKTHERIEFVNFYNGDVHKVRSDALDGKPDAIVNYQRWFNAAAEQLPGVHHYSWLNIERKMRLYREYWQKHWLSLYNMKIDDTAQNNMFFDVPWSKVTDEMITKRAKELENCGGHVFHSKWGTKINPTIKINRDQPKIMKNE